MAENFLQLRKYNNPQIQSEWQKRLIKKKSILGPLAVESLKKNQCHSQNQKSGQKSQTILSKRMNLGTSLVAQWLRIRLPMQGTRVRALFREDPTCHGATKLVRHNYWACALEPASHNYWAHTPQLLKCTRLEPLLCNKRSHRNEKPAHPTKSSPSSPQLEESPRAAMKTQPSQK